MTVTDAEMTDHSRAKGLREITDRRGSRSPSVRGGHVPD
jgi:hypothetical protein